MHEMRRLMWRVMLLMLLGTSATRKNGHANEILAQAAAVALLVAARRGLPVAMHTPTEVKAAVTGNGRADKAQVTAMVSRVLRLDTPPKPADAADAAAIAICHAWRGVATQRLERARREMTSQRSSGTSTQQAAAARR